MAKNTETYRTKTARTESFSILNSSSPQTFFTAGLYGSKILGLTCSAALTATPFEMFVFNGATYTTVLDSTVTTVAAYDSILKELKLFPANTAGERSFNIESGCTLVLNSNGSYIAEKISIHAEDF